MRRFCGLAALLLSIGCRAPAVTYPSLVEPPAPAAEPSFWAGDSPSSSTAGGSSEIPARLTSESVAAAFLQELKSAHVQAAAERFDATMRKVLPDSRLGDAWSAIVSREGALQHVVLIDVIPRPPRTHFWYRCSFERGFWNAEVVVNAARQVSGLRLAPAPPAWSAPDYADPSSFMDEPAPFGEPPLAGVLTLPRSASGMAVVLVHGSGAQDEDSSTGPAGTGTKLFKDLAWGLGSLGIAVLRYPKRTWAWPEQFEGKAFTLDDEVTNDACLAVKAVSERLKVSSNRVVVVAHSLGAAMTPRIARICPGMGGLVLLAGPSRMLDDVLFDQFEYLHSLAGKDRDEVALALQDLMAGFAIALGPAVSPEEELAFSGMRAPRSYWSDVAHYDPAREAGLAPPVPMLVLQGERDYQVKQVDFDGWKRALRGRADVTFKSYRQLDHRFVVGSGPATPAEYDGLAHVDGAVVADIAAWVERRRR